ncbi:MAG: DUF1365 domain-containing protein [Alphaproteobacteria bacterium]|nr:DUF1365 domain-containing protein [Alphaproteobacteria bacterium]
MEITPQIFTAKVMHKRLFPKVNQFVYGTYYLALPLQQLTKVNDGWRIGYNRKSLLTIHDKDHGAKDGSSLETWIRTILAQQGFSDEIANITLVTMPRVLGYVFNPVSFWICMDAQQNIRAMLSEVNNTFGETHSYFCANNDHSPINSDQWLHADKLFHVSPFLERHGTYHFRIAHQEGKLGIWIDYTHENGEKQLLTSLIGSLEPLTRANLRRVFWRHPLVTLTTIALIHWQAIKLARKGIHYIVKPSQREEKLSVSKNLPKPPN